MEFQPSKEELDHLKEWIGKSPHIVQDYDEKILSAFVRGCKGRLQKTKEVLAAFNSLGQRYPEIIKNYDPLDERLVEHLSQSVLFRFPKKTPDGSHVCITAFRGYEDFKIDPSKAHCIDILRYLLLSIYIHFWKDEFGARKLIIVCDCKGVTPTNGKDLTPVVVKQWIEILQNALPIRLQGIHMINIPPFLKYVCDLGKALLKGKLSDRMHFHSTMDTVFEKIPKETFPKEYGGDEDSSLTLHDRWYTTVLSYREQFLQEESKMRKLDHLRPKIVDEDEMIGTFKSLHVD